MFRVLRGTPFLLMRRVPMKLALIQTVSPEGDVDGAFATLARSLKAAGAAGARLLTAPETFLPGYNLEDPGIGAFSREALAARLAPLCREAGCGVVVGYAEREGGALYNSAIAVGADGSDLANYRKIQLFGPREKALYGFGEAYATFKIDGVKAALLICFDIEFAPHIEALRRQGVKLVLCPTANMLPFNHVSHATVPAHAANHQMGIVYANYCGAERELTYAGASVIAGPHGEILAQAGDGEAFLVADVPSLNPVRRFDVMAEYRPVA